MSIWWSQDSPIGEVVIVASGDGVERIWFDGPGNGAIDTAAIVGSARAGRDRAVARELDEWFAGSRQRFTLAVAWPDDL